MTLTPGQQAISQSSDINQIVQNIFIELDQEEGNPPTNSKVCEWAAEHPELFISFIVQSVSDEFDNQHPELMD